MSDGMLGYGMEVYCKTKTESKSSQFQHIHLVNAAWGYKVVWVMWIRAVNGFKTMIEDVYRQ